MGQELTTANKILVAASQIAETQETFTAEDLIVRAWQQFPESFGLSGYREKFPDSNRVLSKLMGSVGLCSRGWLEQVSTKTYRMTPAGRKLASALRSNGDAAAIAEAMDRPRAAAPARAERVEKTERVERPVAPAPVEAAKPRVRDAEEIRSAAKTAERPAAIAAAPATASAQAARVAPAAAIPAPAATPARPAPAPVRAAPAPVAARAATPSAIRGAAPGASNFEGLHILQRLATSIASQKFSRGGLVTFQDACQFWAITPAIHPTHLQPRLGEIEALLKRAEKFIQETGVSIRVHDRLEITMTTVIGLQGLHRMLAQRYHKELEGIRGKASSSNLDEG
jgi:hypothetical protein